MGRGFYAGRPGTFCRVVLQKAQTRWNLYYMVRLGQDQLSIRHDGEAQLQAVASRRVGQV